MRWPDFRLPADPADAVTALREVRERSAEERVEIACDGGRGRTGTAIALLARLFGVPADDAVTWARLRYRPDAVETPWQRASSAASTSTDEVTPRIDATEQPPSA